MTVSVYWHYDAGGRLLYVGSTGNVALRSVQHRDKPWWSEVATSRVEHFDDRDLARRAEQRAIEGESPLYNSIRAEGKTPLHSFRVEDELWEAAKKRAEEKGETLADALRKFLRRYTR